MFANPTTETPTKWTYVADTSRPAVYAASFRMLSLRLTVQATRRNKFNVFWDEQMPCEGGAVPGAGNDISACRRSGDGEYFAGGTAAPTPRASATAAPETAAYRDVREPGPAGEVDVAGDEPIAARKQRRSLLEPVWWEADAGREDQRLDSRGRTVFGHLRQQRQHTRSYLPLPATGPRTSTCRSTGARLPRTCSALRA